MSQSRLFTLLNKAGITDRQQRLAFCTWMVGRDITSSTELTHLELYEITTQLWKWDKTGVLTPKVTAAIGKPVVPQDDGQEAML